MKIGESSAPLRFRQGDCHYVQHAAENSVALWDSLLNGTSLPSLEVGARVLILFVCQGYRRNCCDVSHSAPGSVVSSLERLMWIPRVGGPTLMRC